MDEGEGAPGSHGGHEVAPTGAPTMPRLGPAGLLGSAATGVAMGVVELVPGFSAGTVALVAGVYDRLVASIRQGARVLSLLLRGRVRDAVGALLAIEWGFVLALFGAMAVAVFAAADVISRLLAAYPVQMSAVFLGLVVGAALVTTREVSAWQLRYGLVALGTGALTWVALGFRPGVIEDPALPVLGLGAAVAVCAWILPGLSGAFLLLLLGLYHPVVEAVGERDLPSLAVIALGLVIGVSTFSTLLHWLLSHHRDVVIAAAIGLMLGSVRLLWPWPSQQGVGGSTVVGTPVAAEAPLALVLATGAFALVCLFGLVAWATQRRRR